MSEHSTDERRRHERFETDLKLEFCVAFDLKTKLEYQVKDQMSEAFSKIKYSAVSRNVSAEGISFFCTQRLASGNRILMEVYLPTASNPIKMDGEVRWSEPCFEDNHPGQAPGFITGVKITTVDGSSVEKSIAIDPYHKILWSIVLESVFGSFKHLMLQRKSSSPHSI